MGAQITTKDIAEKLGVSRGTVSKALNGRDKIDERTRRLIKKTAAEMGYKNPKTAQPGQQGVPVKPSGIISLMIREYQVGGGPGSYWPTLMKSFGEEVAARNHKYMVNVISSANEETLSLPKSFESDPPAGIVTIGPINRSYYQRIQSSKIPAVFIDTASNVSDSEIFGDTLFICNREYTFNMTSHLIEQGHVKLGFIGSCLSARSFQERYGGFCDALEKNNIPPCGEFIFNNDVDLIRDWMLSLKRYPTAFVCANDLYALLARATLNESGLDVPKDIALCGFDNDPGASLLFPDLTTVDSHVQYIGKRALQELFWRIENPGAPYEAIKITSDIYYRNSTEGYVFPKK